MPSCVRGVGDRAGLVGRVDGAELGRLGDRDDARLHVVLVAALAPPSGATSSGVSLPCSVATVSSLVPASRSGAPHSSTCMWATSVQITASNGRVRASIEATLAPVPLKTKKAAGVGAEVLAEELLGALGPGVGAVGAGVALVGGRDRLEHLGVGPGVVVGGEVARRPAATARSRVEREALAVHLRAPRRSR